MLSRFFQGRSKSPVRIRLTEPIRVVFVAYFRAPAGETPTAEGLLERTKEWYGQRPAPLGPALVDFANAGDLLSVLVVPRGEVPDPPTDSLRALRAGEAELRRFEASTHVALISAWDLVKAPSVGLWAALGAAIAVSRAYDGAVIDPSYPRLLSDEETDREFPENGAIVITHHIQVLYSLDRRGQTWMTTKGMGRFGLPELEMIGVPPNLPDMALPLVNGIASVLLDSARAVEGEPGVRPRTWVVGPEIRLDTRQIARAHGEEGGDPEEGVRGWTTVRLEYRPGRRGHDSFLRLVPPRHHTGGQGVWLNAALGDLFGVERTIVQVSDHDEAMARAQERAVATLPQTKARFQKGLGLGEQLYVKHAFPRDEEGQHEFMWVVVNTWKGDRIRGVLANDPAYRIDLRAGQTVDLTDADVIDWLLDRADGTHEGNFTGEVLSTQHDEPDSDE